VGKAPSEHKIVLATQAARSRFYVHDSKVMLIALNKTIEPVIAKFITHSHVNLEIDHLVKPGFIKDAIVQIYKDVSPMFARSQYEALVQRYVKSEWDDELDDFIAAFIEGQGAEMVTAITDTTRKQIKSFLEDAIHEGTGAADMAGALRNYFSDFNRTRAMLIARTEIHRASNFGSYTSRDMFQKDYDATLIDTWLHAGNSPLSRSTHEAADGQQRQHGTPFNLLNGYSPLYPQDGSGGAEEEANCNCLVYSFRKRD
jgi:hypothetical protein